MCLVTKNPIQTAENDIVVYKTTADNLVSLSMGFQYELDKLYISNIEESDSWLVYDSYSYRIMDGIFSILFSGDPQYGGSFPSISKMLLEKGYKCYGKGFHSFISIERVNQCNWDNEIIVKCIIPAGSKYIIGEDECVISNQLMLVEIIDKLS